MRHTGGDSKNRFWQALTGWLAALGLFYGLSRFNYLLFHMATEMFAVVVASLLYIITVRTHRYAKNGYLLFIGIAYLFVGVFDLFHAVAYKGMGVLPTGGADPATKLWIAGRATEAVSFLAAGLLRGRKVEPFRQYLVYSLVVLVLLHGILISDWFPSCFQDGVGLTPFKIHSEYAIVALLVASLAMLSRDRQLVGPVILRGIQTSIALTIAGELSFTLYTDVYGFMNAIGHVAKVASYGIILRLALEYGIERPYDAVFRELSDMTVTDSLTGALNRRGFFTRARETMAALDGDPLNPMGLLLFDMDEFKTVNDTLGHQTGDRVLTGFAGILRQVFPDAVIGRMGGDEFIVLTPHPRAWLEEARERIAQSFMNWGILEFDVPLQASCGIACRERDAGISLEDLIASADKDMYVRKGSAATASFLREPQV